MSAWLEKVVTRADAAAHLAALPRPVVFTNGVFDVLHRGHVAYLHAARQLGASLVVAVNSDASARQLGKGPERPLNRAEDRAAVLAGLASVSMVTFFDERTPVELIRALKPDIYVKGGDYDMEALEETAVVRSWGGQSLAIPFVNGYSTTSLVKRIQGQGGRKAAFLDRDGVINVDRAYVHHWEDFAFVPGAIEAMRDLQDAGYALVVVTNQSGIARGMYTEADFARLTERMLQHLQHAGVSVTAVYHCPHHPKGSVQPFAVACDCRKPEPGMILQAAREHGLSVADSLMVGDKPADMQAARAAGVGRAYLVRSDNKESVETCTEADAVFDDLRACVSQVLAGA